MVIKKTIKSIDEISSILDTINTEEYSLVNYIWTEYGFWPIYFNELFNDFFKDTDKKIGFCFSGHEVFYEKYVDILVTLDGFVDSRRAYKNNEETELLLNNFKKISDRGIAFWYTLRNFDEDLYEDAFSGYVFKNILYPIGKDLHWKLGWPPGPGYKYAEGEDGTWYTPAIDWYTNGMQSWNINSWDKSFNKGKGVDLENYNTFFVKNTWKTRKYSSNNIQDFLVSKSDNYDFGSVDFEVYSKVVNFHIENKKNLLIINDLVKFPVVDNEYITYLDMEGFLDVRLLLTVIDESDTFIHTGTSPGDLATYYCNADQVVIGNKLGHDRTQFISKAQELKNKKLFRFYREEKNFEDLFLFLKN